MIVKKTVDTKYLKTNEVNNQLTMNAELVCLICSFIFLVSKIKQSKIKIKTKNEQTKYQIKTTK